MGLVERREGEWVWCPLLLEFPLSKQLDKRRRHFDSDFPQPGQSSKQIPSHLKTGGSLVSMGKSSGVGNWQTPSADTDEQLLLGWQ